MSLYGRYIEETYGRKEIEGDGWFVTYKIESPYCYLIDMYIVPEERNNNLPVHIQKTVEEIAQEQGCTKILTTVDHRNSSMDRVLKAVKKCGYSFYKSNHLGMLFIKDI